MKKQLYFLFLFFISFLLIPFDLDLFATGLNQKKLKMTIRSDAGVRAGKKLSGLGRLAKFSMLKFQYSGVVDRT